MNVLIVGGGGREHAMAWACAKSALVSRVFVAPGNAGTAFADKCENVPIGVNDFAALVALVKDAAIDLTIVGPEEPLVKGIKDYFEGNGLLCLGPHASVAQLEGSKAFAKQFMAEEGIPTAAYFATSDLDAAIQHIKTQGAPIVVKADGLAAGKGVVLAQSIDEAIDAVTEMLSGNRHGEAGRHVVLEEFLVGEEASFTVLSDGNRFVSFANSQDHKPIYDADLGPNTGGMGAYSPAPIVTEAIEAQILDQVVRPVVTGMRKRGTPYVGFLYAGLMITPKDEVKVVEFNCRFGDPETQAVLLRLQSDFAQVCLLAAQGQLPESPLENTPESSVCVVMASGGYPGSYRTGHAIEGLEHVSGGVEVFHAGTTLVDNQIVTSGGRVLTVNALGPTVEDAQQRVYQEVAQIEWHDAYYRKDIGHRALERSDR